VTFVLAAFLGIIYFSGLAFVFYPELISTLVVVGFLGVLGSFWNTFRSYWGILSLLLYTLAILLTWLLQTYVFH